MNTQQCRDCGVKSGQFHQPGCSNELCGICLDQAITCDCDPEHTEMVAERIPYRGESADVEDELISESMKPRVIALIALIVVIALFSAIFS